jgi:thymidylate synthase (FAD)
LIEKSGRVCYRSEAKMSEESGSKFVSMIFKRGHHSVLEHASLSLRIICSRGLSHELIRHRIVAISQESQRYVSYSNRVEFIRPIWYLFSSNNQAIQERYNLWLGSITKSAQEYNKLRELGASAQEAREVLPNSCKTELVVTANVREWLHIVSLRTSEGAHPHMRLLMFDIQEGLHELLPEIFESPAASKEKFLSAFLERFSMTMGRNPAIDG